ncbi:MAG: hypothetical protein LBD86_06645 [Spirochaetaceae bacterium]|jgi:hypothetical protein|nr:hypothetical protein [Spirochaetaceae bacterium]
MDSPLDGQEPAEGGIDDWVILREDGGNALEVENIIWRDQEPYRLTLKVDENVWEDMNWYLDSDAPVKTGHSVTLDARILKETKHTLVFTGSRQGFPHSITIPFTVKASRAGNIGWIETEKNSSLTEFDLGSWTGWGEALETWKLWAVESSDVYFTVYKQNSQTISVEGTDAGKVKKADIGAVVDGSTASPELDVFTVDAGDEDTLFKGGELNFTLRVWEPGKAETKLVAVNLELMPRLTGAAIFAVTDGRLERITADNVDTYGNGTYQEHLGGEFPGWGIDISGVNNLAGALKWLDSYAASGEEGKPKEYLVRVEKNEILNQTLLSGKVRESSEIQTLVSNIKVRLRGYGVERSITHNTSEAPRDVLYKGGSGSNYLTSTPAFLMVMGSGITLQLEENITIDAAGGKDPNFPCGNMNTIVDVTGSTCTLILKQGARLTNGEGVVPVTIGENGTFEMRGGEISYCKNKDHAIYFSKTTDSNSVPVGTFRYYSGIFKDNDSNYVRWSYSYTHYAHKMFRGE